MIYGRKWKIILGILTIIFVFNVFLVFIAPGTNIKEDINVTDRNLLESRTHDLSFPNIVDFLPHINDDLEAFQPVLKLSKGSHNVSMIIEISTVKREKGSYLSTTLHSIFENISKNKTVTEDILIVVMIAEYIDLQFVIKTTQTLQNEFGRYIDAGYLDIIVPSPSFYPDFSNIDLSFGDGAEQVIWRSKQNLDYAYIMMYARKRGTHYYVQLEDDVKVSFKYWKKKIVKIFLNVLL